MAAIEDLDRSTQRESRRLARSRAVTSAEGDGRLEARDDAPDRALILLELLEGPRDTMAIVAASGMSVSLASNRRTSLRLTGLV